MGDNKKSRGRQRLEMKPIENEKNRSVTFTKRRNGIYKKANELCTLTGTHTAILVTSSTGKNYSFAHPSVESVANRFLHQNSVPEDSPSPLVAAYREAHINELNKQLNDVRAQLEAEKKREKILTEKRNGRRKNCWEAPVDELTDGEAQNVKQCLRGLQALLLNRFQE